jgi:mRNA interferase HicA
VKRSELIRRLTESAHAAGAEFVFVREGGAHSVYRYAGQLVAIPRHREISDRLARGILRGLGIG